MKKVVSLMFVFTILTFALVASAQNKVMTEPEPAQSWIVNSVIKPVGEATCVDGKEHQVMATVATFKDAAGKTSDVELTRWDQATDKACEAKTRGKAPSKPNAEGLKKAMEQVNAKSKARGGKCGCYYVYFEYRDYIYFDYYDCSWNWCAWEIVWR